MKQKEAVSAGTEFIEKDILAFSGSPFDRIGKGWMLITAGNVDGGGPNGSGKDPGNWNTMTASWGGLGVLWHKNVAFIFIRPSRHTFGFANSAKVFTISFFDENCRSALELCGKKSGRDIDKAAAAGLTPVFFHDANEAVSFVSFKEARDVLFCKKLYAQDLDPALFLDREAIEKSYNGSDYHRIYVGEIIGYKAR